MEIDMWNVDLPGVQKNTESASQLTYSPFSFSSNQPHPPDCYPSDGIPTEGAVAPVPLPKRDISFRPASHPAEPFSTYPCCLHRSSKHDPALSLLCSVASDKGPLVKEVLCTSFPTNLDLTRDVIPKRNGFVETAIEAYNNHHKLVVRPDDVWLSIITQFSFFVNGNSEALRETLVTQEGKCELGAKGGGDRLQMNIPFLVDTVTELMKERITAPSLREWIIPDFTTTKQVDKTTSAIVMMGMMKNYFTYKFSLRCGIPEVTLEGEKQDWENILARIEQLKKYGIQTIAWYHLLRPIVARFIAAYDEPNHPDNLEFWNKIAHREYGSGPQWLSGWITAFCVFNERGKWQGGALNEKHVSLLPADALPPFHFVSAYIVHNPAPYLALDGVPYPTIDGQDIPCGYVSLDVLLDDNGEVMDTMFIAGSVGSQVCSTEETGLSRNGSRDTIRPLVAWWYFIKRKEGEKIPDDNSDDDLIIVDESSPMEW